MYTLQILNCKTNEVKYLNRFGRGVADITRALIVRDLKSLEGAHRLITRRLFRTGYFVTFKRI